jgi:hypothetical protein
LLYYYYSISKESLLLITYKNLDKFLICLGENYYYLMMTPRLTALIVVMSLVGAGGPLAAIAQETVADNDTLRKTGSLPIVPNNDEQNSTVNQTDILESNDPDDVIARQLALLRTVAPEVDIENLTASEIGDLLELYGLDTDGPVCPPCP